MSERALAAIVILLILAAFVIGLIILIESGKSEGLRAAAMDETFVIENLVDSLEAAKRENEQLKNRIQALEAECDGLYAAHHEARHKYKREKSKAERLKKGGADGSKRLG